MRCHSVAYGTEVLNDNFSCTWTLCSKQSGDGWPHRSQLQPGFLHSDVVSLYYLQHSAISVYVIHFRHVTKELFSSVTLFCLANLRPQRSELRLDETVVGQTNSNGQVTFQHVGPPCVGAIAFLVTNAEARPARTFDRTQGILTNYVIPLP